MSDDKTKTDARDRSRVAGGESYEVDYFASKHGLSAEQARALIAEIGNNRAELDAAAEKIKAKKAAP